MPSRRLYRQRLAAALLAALCRPAHAQDAARPLPGPAPPARQVPAQPQPSPATDKDEEEVVRISTELVQTDVMVFDKSGKFVEGLGPGQFELKVDGKPQQIAFFERVRAGTVDEDAQIAAARGGSAGGARAGGGAALPLDRGRTVIFFVDDLHLSAGSTSHIRKTLLRFVEDEIGQNDEAAVISASGQVGFLQQLTDNKAVLRAAAGRVNTRPYAVRDGQSPLMTERHAVAIERGEPQVLDYFVDQALRENPMLRREVVEQMVRSRARVIVQQARAIARNTLASLESVVRGYAQLPGRKIVFFISDGFIVDDGDTMLRDRMRIISGAAARAGVVIYSLDAMGLRTGQADASTGGNFDPAGQLARVDMSEGSEMQAPLFHLATETGGRALVNTNALGRVVSGALKETSVYYLLAWRPDLTSGGGAAAPKYRRLEVSVAGRPDLRVMVRRGFYSAEPVEEAPRADGKKSSDKKADGAAPRGNEQKASPGERDLLEALRAPLPRVSLPTSLAVGYVQGEKAGSVLTVSVELEREALTFAQGERPRAEFDVAGAVLDDRGKIVSQFGQRLSVTVNPAVPVSEQQVIYSFSLALQPGLYQVRAATRDSGSGRTGSAMQWVEVPELTKQFSMSSLYIGERPAGQSPASVRPEDIPRSVMLSVDRRFARTSFIRFLTYVYNPAAGTSSPPDVALQVQIFRDDQPVFTAPLIKLKPSGDAGHTTLPYMAELSLSTFPPGRYVFQVTAIDRAGKTSTARRARFFIE